MKISLLMLAEHLPSQGQPNEPEVSLSIQSMPALNQGAISTGSQAVATETIKAPSAEIEFLKEAKKTPAERIQEAVLKKMGLTEEQYKALDSQQKAAIQDEIKAEIKKMIEVKQGSHSGNYLDIKA